MENNRKPPMPGPYYPPFSAGLVGPVSDDLYAAMLDARAQAEAAETAKGKAEDAQEAAETAQGKAEDAQEAAETAQGKAEDAQAAAETAQGKAEAWATGGSSGTPSATNNAKYYSEQAAASAASLEIDNTLSNSGQAADAKATGDHVLMWYTAPASPATFGISDMPRSSYTFLDSSRFTDTPNGATGYACITRRPFNNAGNISLVTFQLNDHPEDYYYGKFTEGVTFGGWQKFAHLNYYTPPESPSTFGVADMPKDSYTYVSPSLFSDCPAQITNSNYNLYIERKSMNESGSQSMITVIERTNLENQYVSWFSAPNDLRPWTKVSGSNNLIEGFRNSTLSSTLYGVTFEWDDEKQMYHAEGTRSGGMAFYNLTRNVPTSGGKVYYLLFDHKTENISADVWGSDGTNTSSIFTGFTGNLRRFTIPSGIKSIYCRVVAKTGVAVDEDFNAYLTEELDAKVLQELALTGNTSSLPSCDLDSLTLTSQFRLLTDSNSYSHTPNNATTGFLTVYRFATWTLQVFYNLNATTMWLRRANASGVWSEWAEVSGSGGTVIQNEYTFNTYNETLTATVSPTITTDANQYLEATGDNTDVKAAIEALLNETGVCRLGPGDFYVSGVNMPENSMLIGSGKKTRMILLGANTDTGYAIHLSSHCTVRDMLIRGTATTNPYPSSYSYVNRHGILFEAAYSDDESTKRRCVVDGCEIRSFSGGGITCYNTGYPVDSTLMVSNTTISNCMVGINIPYWSEFNIFTACKCCSNYYGCINNGGNNLFSACNFSGNRVGMYLDNSQGQSPNNSHGSVVACIFDHSDENEGVGIKIDGCRAGQVFSDCQLFYSSIEVENSSGIIFNNFNIGGSGNIISLTEGDNGGAIIFNGCMFKPSSTTIDVSSGYDKVKFINCYDRNGDAVTAS